MLTLHLILLILALFCFGGAMFDVKPPRVNLLAAGLFLWLLGSLIAR